ncbi:Capsule assembly protein Wzi [Zhouia amylolytica]|uniref:Capsule assembly protein Wzi n=1 Tax=Zhouia amylolytica TaxID=376730 RepID=A0A1I6QRN1_9FLAO|nr:capsule assembly Wzi family protein [Zhouia amylolytica]SFS55065.1 Capsule assembly protein Wzi [Zhouia amylolytica]
MNYKFQLVVLLITLPILSNAQNTEISGRIELGGYASVRDSLPFWMVSNTYGRMEPDTRAIGLAEARVQHRLGEQSFLEAGGGILFNDAAAPVLRVDSWYAQYQNQWFGVIGGKKQRPMTYGGLSTSGESILWSDNARPMPGMYAYTSEPIALVRSKKLLFDAYWGEYLMDDERYVDNARVHSKGLTFVYRFNPQTELSVGLEHVAQWAGTHPVNGALPARFKDYLKIITGSSGGEGAVEGDQINALGNSIGSYRIRFKKHYDSFNMELFWNNIFEDRSGRELNNLPDGRYGIYLEKKQPIGLVHNVLYEYYYMKSHSDGAPFMSTGDDYFNNYVYLSGWSYNQQTIGSPLFLTGGDVFGIVNNRFTAHHLGIGGSVKQLPYRLLLTYSRNYGLRRRGEILQEGKNVFSSRFDLNIPVNFADLKFIMASDFAEVSKPKFAVGLHMVKRF